MFIHYYSLSMVNCDKVIEWLVEAERSVDFLAGDAGKYTARALEKKVPD